MSEWLNALQKVIADMLLFQACCKRQCHGATRVRLEIRSTISPKDAARLYQEPCAKARHNRQVQPACPGVVQAHRLEEQLPIMVQEQ